MKLPGVTVNLPKGSADYLDPDGWLEHFIFEVAHTNKIQVQDAISKINVIKKQGDYASIAFALLTENDLWVSPW